VNLVIRQKVKYFYRLQTKKLIFMVLTIDKIKVFDNDLIEIMKTLHIRSSYIENIFLKIPTYFE